jgi:hypothetical protein
MRVLQSKDDKKNNWMSGGDQNELTISSGELEPVGGNLPVMPL